MNKKAESFKKYLDDNKIKSFTVDEIARLKALPLTKLRMTS